jgi:hypothetical protein
VCTVLLPPGGNPIAVKKYIKYQIKESRRGQRILTVEKLDEILYILDEISKGNL